ncbi:hypothetical protein AAOGI_44760 [Agarivorans albus]
MSVEADPSPLSSEPEFAFDMDEVKGELVEPVVEEPEEQIKARNATGDFLILNVMTQSGR